MDASASPAAPEFVAPPDGGDQSARSATAPSKRQRRFERRLAERRLVRQAVTLANDQRVRLP